MDNDVIAVNNNAVPVVENRWKSGDVSSLTGVDIEYAVIPVSSLKTCFIGDKTKFKTRREENDNMRLQLSDGRVMAVTDSMFDTFAKMFGLSRTTFDYWSGEDVFKAVGLKNTGGVRLCFDVSAKNKKNDTSGSVLSFTNPNRAVLDKDGAIELIKKYSGTEVTYQDGVISASFDCPFQTSFQITGKQDSTFQTRFAMDFPLHGYGLPASFLQIYRQVCSNGAVVRHKAFRTEFSLGKDDKDIGLVLDRAISSFNNEEGFHALNDRFRTASRSWASFRELVTLSDALTTSMAEEKWGLTAKHSVMRRLSDLTGDPMTLWSISNLKDLSHRHMRTLPVRATVYELLNFASELSTHNFKTPRSRNRIAGWIGDRVVSEYDLENTVEQFPEFRDIYVEINYDNAVRNRQDKPS